MVEGHVVEGGEGQERWRDWCGGGGGQVRWGHIST